jgi:hypothetical protein
MPDDFDNGYEVGFGKPPKATRFKKGQSGNPAGKRKAARSAFQELERFLDTPIVVNENGCRKQMRPMEIVRKKVFQIATQGNVQAIKLMIEMEKLAGVNRFAARENEVDLRRAVELFDKLAGGVD